MPAERYMDKEVYENELKQVLGAVHSAHDLDEHTVLIRGQHGALMCACMGVRNCMWACGRDECDVDGIATGADGLGRRRAGGGRQCSKV